MTNAFHSFSRRGLVIYFAALAALTTTTASVLANATILPAEQQSGDVRYVTGGIALEESTAMKAAMPSYPLVVEVYQQGAGGKNEFTASSVLTITTAQGDKVLNTTLEGPFALLRLKPGRYDVRVELEGQVKQSRVDVKQHGSARAPFVFKE